MKATGGTVVEAPDVSADLKDAKKDGLIVEANDVSKSFLVGTKRAAILKSVSLKVSHGEFVIIHGPSGSGKSTLLNCLIGLEPITKGEILVGDQRLDMMDDDDRAQMRVKTFGVVYQQPIWIKSLTVLENVALPLLIRGATRPTALRHAHKHLREVHMHRYANRKPTEISGGEQQRVGLARSLINNPKVLVLDEPTGNLDTHTADEMLKLLKGLNRQEHITIIMVTHNLAYLPIATKTVEIRDGKVKNVKITPHKHESKE